MLECPVLRNFPRFADQLQFTQHNIRLDDGTFTKPESARSMVDYPYFKSARGILETVFPGDKSRFRLADVGCLEGGYAVEFARMGFQVVGIEVRDLNIAACDYAKSKTDLPNLQFVQDNALNIASHGLFDAVFCCGLFYHLDDPKQYLETLSSVTKKLLILVTHFSLINPRDAKRGLPTAVRSAWSRLQLGLDALRKPDVNFNLLLRLPANMRDFREGGIQSFRTTVRSAREKLPNGPLGTIVDLFGFNGNTYCRRFGTLDLIW